MTRFACIAPVGVVQVLTRGLQHASPLIRFTVLNLLGAIADRFVATLQVRSDR